MGASLFTETRLQTKHATCKEIHDGIKENYGLCVTDLAVSWTKDLCGLAKAKKKDIMGPHGSDASDLAPEKAVAVHEVFIRFGIIKKE